MALSTGWIHQIEAWQHSGLSQVAYYRQYLNYSFSARLYDYRKAKKARYQLNPSLDTRIHRIYRVETRQRPLG
ncbi:MAG: hypothetical protein Q7T96_00650 [Methylobacter sp.]|nr:hypothetical protein [Methylobacter sp.]